LEKIQNNNRSEEFCFCVVGTHGKNMVTTVQQDVVCVILYAVDTLRFIPYSDMLDLHAVSQIWVQVCLLCIFPTGWIPLFGVRGGKLLESNFQW
jgi:hypothetical protein